MATLSSLNAITSTAVTDQPIIQFPDTATNWTSTGSSTVTTTTTAAQVPMYPLRTQAISCLLVAGSEVSVQFSVPASMALANCVGFNYISGDGVSSVSAQIYNGVTLVATGSVTANTTGGYLAFAAKLTGGITYTLKLTVASSLSTFYLNGLFVGAAMPAVGQTSGNTVQPGIIGETIEQGNNTFYTTTVANIFTQTLQPGKWRIAAYTSINTGGGPTGAVLSISTTSATHDTNNYMFMALNTSTGLACGSNEIIVTISTPTTYYITGQATGATITNYQRTRLICQRIG